MVAGFLINGILRKRIETRKREVKNKLYIQALGLYFRPVSTWLRVCSFFLLVMIMKPKKKVHGVGINDADYVTQRFETIGYVSGDQKQKLAWKCPFYQTWGDMLKRCYSEKYQEKKPTYRGCTVSDAWLTFSNFKNWMMAQDWEGKHLDKDLLIEGNKVYSADTCVFVTRMVNNFTTDREAARGEWMIGVSWHKGMSKFKSDCRNPFTKKGEYLGLFTSELEAHQAWLKRKLKLAKELAAIQEDDRVAKALIERYSKPYTDKALK